NSDNNEVLDTNELRKKFKNWETLSVDENIFKEYLDTLKKPGFEGIWISAPYTIGIEKIEGAYLGFIIEADGIYWTKGQIKLKIDDSLEKPEGKFYMKDHSLKAIDKVKLIGNNYLMMDDILLKRIYPEIEEKGSIER